MVDVSNQASASGEGDSVLEYCENVAGFFRPLHC